MSYKSYKETERVIEEELKEPKLVKGEAEFNFRYKENIVRKLFIRGFKEEVVFLDDNKIFADFVIKLQQDKISKRKFLLYLILLYVEEDPDMMKCVVKMKNRLNIYRPSPAKGYKVLKDTRIEGERLMRDLNINEEDMSEIFDFIEEENEEK